MFKDLNFKINEVKKHLKENKIFYSILSFTSILFLIIGIYTNLYFQCFILSLIILSGVVGTFFQPPSMIIYIILLFDFLIFSFIGNIFYFFVKNPVITINIFR